jgi:hypothetical protein
MLRSMTVLRADVRLPWDIAVAGPLSSNTFHFEHTAVADAPLLVGGALKTMYEGLSVFSSHLTGEVRVQVFDLADPTPRAPVHTTSGTLTPGASSLPGECAMLLTGWTTPQDNVIRSRFQSRIFVGPLHQGVIGSDGLATEAAMQEVLDAFSNLGGNLALSNIVAVAGSEANGWRGIEGGRVTNELATVRRRQLSATQVLTAP